MSQRVDRAALFHLSAAPVFCTILSIVASFECGGKWMQRRDATETIETVSLDEVHSMSCLDFKSDTRCDKILPLLHWRIDILFQLKFTFMASSRVTPR